MSTCIGRLDSVIAEPTCDKVPASGGGQGRRKVTGGHPHRTWFHPAIVSKRQETKHSERVVLDRTVSAQVLGDLPVFHGGCTRWHRRPGHEGALFSRSRRHLRWPIY